MFLRDIPYIAEDLTHLRAHDPVFAPLDIKNEYLPWHTFEHGFEGLVRVVQSQQIAAKVADMLWAKLKQAGQGAVSAEFVLSLSAEQLKPFGMSAQKTKYIQLLAHDVMNGTFDPAALQTLSNDEAMARITTLKGFGPWSAQIYLMFCEQRRNILPAGDLVLDRAIQAMFDLPERPTYAVLQEMTQHWEGRYTAASLLCWAVYTRGLI